MEKPQYYCPTPIETDNSTDLGIVSSISKKIKAMDMRLYWVKDWTSQ